ncbi:MAG: hypothetical protein COA58_06540 [Bacteroidetes bacterium]|nr:MAG: hypothetical protein COA58_06540 [Bacteroidota bacterium]
MKISIVTILIFLNVLCIGQTVTITSSSEVCLNELIGFKAVVSGTATSFSWDFGDNTSASQQNPAHTYNTVGVMNVKVTVNFSGGGSQTVTKSITVHDVPVADFSLDNSSFCFNSQKVCLKDESNMGTTTSGYSNRLILWGDGSQVSNSSPSVGDNICYNSYPLISPPKYKIIVEVVNDKGCENKWEEEISILKDYKPSFRTYIDQPTCDSQNIRFLNDSSLSNIIADLDSFEWDFGDGATYSSSSSGWSTNHSYTISGVYVVTLTVTLKNGCQATFTRSHVVRIPDFEAKIGIQDSVRCYPLQFIVSTPLVLGGAAYTWELYNTDTTFIQISGYNLVQGIIPPCPGDFLLRLKVRIGLCSKYSRYVHLKSQGVKADFRILNKNQCMPLDTMYFLNMSKVHPDAIVQYSWNFDDVNASNCIGWPLNCNNDTGFHSQHFYTDTGCFSPILVATDITTGCTTERERPSVIDNPDYAEFERVLDRPCYGQKNEYAISFSDNLCENIIPTGGEVHICYDSAVSPLKFYPFAAGGKRIYKSVGSSDGWVTVGFIIKSGSQKIYRSADTSDFYYDLSHVCRDTIWYHKWFRLYPEPEMKFLDVNDTNCLPILKTISYTGSEEDKIKYFKYTWDLNDPYVIDTIPPDTIPTISHLYTSSQKGRYSIILEDTFGCYDILSRPYINGYLNEFMGDTIICIGQEVLFVDSLRYYSDLVGAYWRDPSRPEKISWDFDEGDDFTTYGPEPTYIFANKGWHTIKMASIDKNGCTDTAYMDVLVGGINAAMKNNSEDYLCDQILQFFDSSFFDFPITTDIIKRYTWDFGDNSTKSYLKNPFHYYSSNGNFVITLAIETEAGCKDTAEIPVYLKGPEPYFDIVSDTVGCVPYTVTFKSESKFTSAFVWNMGDNANTTIFAESDTTFSFTYSEPGIYYVSLEGSDSFYNEVTNNKYTCYATFPDTSGFTTVVRRIVVLQIPEVRFDFDEPACVGQPVVFRNISDTIYKNLHWRVEDVDSTTTSDLIYVFKEAGTYDVLFTPTYLPEGDYQRECFDTFFNTVTVTDVHAGFSYVKQGLCSEFVFTDSSKNAVRYSWDFDHLKSKDDNYSDLPNPVHVYGKDSGSYKVCQTVYNSEGCQDSACEKITVEYIKDIEKYNVFTPSDVGDGQNDAFFIDITNHKLFELKIYNRWGERVFYTNDPLIGWMGRHNNEGNLLPEGTYFYVLNYMFNCESVEREAEGTIDLIWE